MRVPRTRFKINSSIVLFTTWFGRVVRSNTYTPTVNGIQRECMCRGTHTETCKQVIVFHFFICCRCHCCWLVLLLKEFIETGEGEEENKYWKLEFDSFEQSRLQFGQIKKCFSSATRAYSSLCRCVLWLHYGMVLFPLLLLFSLSFRVNTEFQAFYKNALH